MTYDTPLLPRNAVASPVGEAESPAFPLPKISPTAARYIKLGKGGKLAPDCIEQGLIRLGFDGVQHSDCLAGDWETVRHTLSKPGRFSGVEANQARQIEDFYTLGADTLWMTFWEGKLWWAFAEPGVVQDKDYQHLTRYRRTIGPWRCTDIDGKDLHVRDISTKLTQLAAFRGTLCNVRQLDYLLRRINAEAEPLVVEAEALQGQLVDMARRLVAALHWRDFEILVDRIFADSGWRRVGVLGETQADVDLIVEQTATGERAFVQVKSKATPAVLEDYIDRFRDYGDCSRMFFICHSPKGKLRQQAVASDVELWFAETVAEKAIRAGLFQWLVQRVR